MVFSCTGGMCVILSLMTHLMFVYLFGNFHTHMGCMGSAHQTLNLEFIYSSITEYFNFVKRTAWICCLLYSLLMQLYCSYRE